MLKTDCTHTQVFEEETVMTELTPQEIPPSEEAAMMEDAQAQPSEELTEEAMQALGDIEPMPEEMPPEMGVAAAVAAGVWHSGKKITSLWSINQNRNSWVRVSGLGWKKLANNSDSAIVALTMLASHAKQANRNVNLREESSQIKEMYVW